MIKYIIILMVIVCINSPLKADSDNANPLLHIPLSAGLTYGIYSALHDGVGIENKWGCYGIGGMITFMLSTMWEFDEYDNHHFKQALLFNGIGISLPIPLVILDK